MTMETIDCLVVGAGVVGLAIARELALRGREVVVIEAAGGIGTGTSSRNSEVIHAGIYYPQGSLKAQLCVRGRDLLYDFCASRHIPHQRLGKLIVATSTAQLAALDRIAGHASANGVGDLRLIDAAGMAGLEPELTGVGALLSPSTGIVDSHALMLALQGEAENEGAVFAFRTPFVEGRIEGRGAVVRIGEDGESYRTRLVVNAAGLEAHLVAARIDGVAPGSIPAMRFAKGNYFGCAAKVPFGRLIYPVPVEGGLGVHLTLDTAGNARFGPDVEWIDAIDYTVAAERAMPFYEAIRSYWPGLPDGSLFPDYCGIRPKAGGANPDFVIDDAHRPALVNLYGIESPGLTSCLAIASLVAAMADAP